MLLKRKLQLLLLLLLLLFNAVVGVGIVGALAADETKLEVHTQVQVNQKRHQTH